MDILNNIITGLNKEQVRFFKLYLSRIETEDDRKDVLLFDYIRKTGEKFNDDKIFRKLYQNGNSKNPYYRLKNRLMRELNKSLTLQHFDDEEMVYAFRLLALVKYYFNKNQIKTAYFFLKKAESKARSIESHELLDIIYGEFIRLSREMITVNPEEYILSRNENLKQLNQVRAIDDILAAVTYRLKVTQNYATADNTVLNTLEKTINDFTADKKLKKSPLLRFKIYHAVSQILLQKHQYALLENYLLKTFREFSKEKLFSRNNHDTKLQMLTYLVNSMYKNGKLKQSLQYAELLKKSMNEFNKLLFDKYMFYYYNSLVINYSQLDNKKAISILEDLKENEKIKNNPFYQQFIYLNLFTLWFDRNDYHKAAKNLTRLYLLKDYNDTNPSLRFKIAVADLITRYELKDFETFEYKLKLLKKDFKLLMNKKEHAAEKELISILKGMFDSVDIQKNKLLIGKINRFVNQEANESNTEDTEVINYRQWLQEAAIKLNLDR